MVSDKEYIYEGQELELFRDAKNWKAYFGRQLLRYVSGDVLEAGAGIGSNTSILCRGPVKSWTCLEPDHVLARQLGERVRAESEFALRPTVVVGTLADIPATDLFDTILYIDVLEHIENDQMEMARASQHLRHGGHLVVLAPAHPYLFSPFDKAIGHYRRYNRGMFYQLKPPGCELVRAYYLDSCGLLASLGNRLLLSASNPTPGQIAFWDRILVRLSKVVDIFTGYQIGKTVVGVWKVTSR